MNPILCIAIHTHQYGVSIYPFYWTQTERPTQEFVIKTFDIDFEEDKEEVITIDTFSEEIQTF
jgi:hypothetical protein